MGPKTCDFVSHSGPPVQRAISGTTGQVGSSETGSQDYPSFLFRSPSALPISSSLAGSSERQPRAEVATAGLNGALGREKGSWEYLAGRFAQEMKGCIREL